MYSHVHKHEQANIRTARMFVHSIDVVDILITANVSVLCAFRYVHDDENYDRC